MLISPCYISLAHFNPLFLLIIPSTMLYFPQSYSVLLILHLFFECVHFNFLFGKNQTYCCQTSLLGMPCDQHIFGAIPECPGQRNAAESFRIFSLVLSNSKLTCSRVENHFQAHHILLTLYLATLLPMQYHYLP